MSDEANAEEAEYGLVMPFLVCESNGGQYADDAFTAGWTCGRIDTLLSTAPLECRSFDFPVAVRSDLIPQLDLIAMRHSFYIVGEAYEDDDQFTFVTFDRHAPEGTT